MTGRQRIETLLQGRSPDSIPLNGTGVHGLKRSVLRLIIRGHDFVKRNEKSCHGGSGSVYIREYRFSDTQPGLRLLHETTVPPGSTIGFHPHPGHEELYIIREGEGFLIDGSTRARVGPGDVCHTACGKAHGLVNNGPLPIKMTVVGVNLPADRP